MKKQLLIIGGGFAGFWSAISAIRQSRVIKKRGDIEITLVNPDNEVTLRPTLNEPLLEGLRFELDKYLKPLGIHQIFGRAEIIHPEKNEVIISTVQSLSNFHYDYLILTTGASLRMPDIPGIGNTFKIDSFANAQILEDHLIELAKKDFNEEGASTFVVAGSEFTGLETVTSVEQKAHTIQLYYSGKKSTFRSILLESESRMASQFSKACNQYVQDVITSKNIEVITGSEIIRIEPAFVLLRNGDRIATRTVIWTKGLAASSLTQFFKGAKDEFDRLHVDQFLKLPAYNNVIAAGNVAHSSGQGTSSLMDCQYAQFEGRWAGHNAVNDLFGVPMKKYVQPGYANCIDLGEPQPQCINDAERDLQREKYYQTAKEKHINRITMYPWQDVEETVKASDPDMLVQYTQSIISRF
ncbi:hypothetical protein FC093_19010 [Ilyomonas limi]|uniref:FAD/NAD(P)-binding domain-containing protein n=1 Tax=Ilyomonas limi TaxID=2575867 RepID=A0A4U3KW35_9BACT|nr:FAD-dependent oxidoreductase [Ilyomonas limi]TKK65844.1 hypothetical protein FC093_19010 [Ilyomonas limi]